MQFFFLFLQSSGLANKPRQIISTTLDRVQASVNANEFPTLSLSLLKIYVGSTVKPKYDGGNFPSW